MSRKIIGVTVGTPIKPSRIVEDLNPVKSVNGITPDENGNVGIAVGGMPEATEEDNGKFLRVVDGAWVAARVDQAEEASF